MYNFKCRICTWNAIYYTCLSDSFWDFWIFPACKHIQFYHRRGKPRSPCPVNPKPSDTPLASTQTHTGTPHTGLSHLFASLISVSSSIFLSFTLLLWLSPFSFFPLFLLDVSSLTQLSQAAGKFLVFNWGDVSKGIITFIHIHRHTGPEFPCEPVAVTKSREKTLMGKNTRTCTRWHFPALDYSLTEDCLCSYCIRKGSSVVPKLRTNQVGLFATDFCLIYSKREYFRTIIYVHGCSLTECRMLQSQCMSVTWPLTRAV